MRQHFPQLMGGISGAALHGLNQLGYAIESADPIMLPQGIAYLAFTNRALSIIHIITRLTLLPVWFDAD